MLQGMTALT